MLKFNLVWFFKNSVIVDGLFSKLLRKVIAFNAFRNYESLKINKLENSREEDCTYVASMLF